MPGGQPVRVIRVETDLGLPAITRNLAINIANGEYIALLDDDDFWYETKLEK
jgi:glycosyltransferase involved in cell wall biosynthesis